MSEPRRGMTRALDRLTTGVIGVACVSLVVMALIQAWQVFARYVLNDSPGWTEPLALLLMSFVVMFGAAVAVRRETHFAFQSVQDALPAPGRRAVVALARLISASAGVGLMWLGATLMIDNWSVALAGAPLPSGLRYAGLTVGGALILIFSIERLMLGDYRKPDPVAED